MSSKWESNDFSIANSEQGTFYKSCLFRCVHMKEQSVDRQPADLRCYSFPGSRVCYFRFHFIRLFGKICSAFRGTFFETKVNVIVWSRNGNKNRKFRRFLPMAAYQKINGSKNQAFVQQPSNGRCQFPCGGKR